MVPSNRRARNTRVTGNAWVAERDCMSLRRRDHPKRVNSRILGRKVGTSPYYGPAAPRRVLLAFQIAQEVVLGTIGYGSDQGGNVTVKWLTRQRVGIHSADNGSKGGVRDTSPGRKSWASHTQ